MDTGRGCWLLVGDWVGVAGWVGEVMFFNYMWVFNHILSFNCQLGLLVYIFGFSYSFYIIKDKHFLERQIHWQHTRYTDNIHKYTDNNGHLIETA